ncbi:ornithine cyclodeaminase family protein [Bacillus chungangensis]|uniref:Ornithine cyclodeaminase n=1 Tax=Bacillus chungangensis TaxID=587633 RepID=A0ABT9WXV2_9BACI|nr:ornithine cyclodeaminase family protein [Bacillus chungangensis]MDQ0178118.1 ornithine cyclodeaminase [Bacillus chungangensis]
MDTLILTKSEVQQLLDVKELHSELISGFRNYSIRNSSSGVRIRSTLKNDNSSAMILFPGLINDIPAFTIKNHAKFPSEKPAIKGIINLFDLNTGELLAIMESSYITAVRTGLAGAIGTHLLARKEAQKVALIGAGAQGKLQIQSLSYLRDFSDIFIFDTFELNAITMVNELKNEIKANWHVCQCLEEAVADADIIITATWSKKPFLFPHLIKKGTHITTLGPDEPYKAEVDAELLKQAIFVCDDKELAVSMGAAGGVGLDKSVINCEIGEIIENPKLGRTNEEQITIYGMVGLPFQDLAGAWQVFKKAKEINIGKIIKFLQ